MIEREEAIETEEARKLEALAEAAIAPVVQAMQDGKAALPAPEVLAKFRDEFEAMGQVRSPRPWGVLLSAWVEMLGSLAMIIGIPPESAGLSAEALVQMAKGGGPVDFHLRAWRWMWTLPPCSEARKAAFTLGHAAMMIDRWRTCGPETERLAAASPDDRGTIQQIATDIHALGQRAEALLRILRWHIDDARGEAHAAKTVALAAADLAPLPSWERVYSSNGYMTTIGSVAWHRSAIDQQTIARLILDDHIEHRREDRARLARIIARTGRDDIVDIFARTAIASLPDGPWTMTSADVLRFVEMLLDDVPAAEKAVSP